MTSSICSEVLLINRLPATMQHVTSWSVSESSCRRSCYKYLRKVEHWFALKHDRGALTPLTPPGSLGALGSDEGQCVELVPGSAEGGLKDRGGPGNNVHIRGKHLHRREMTERVGWARDMDMLGTGQGQGVGVKRTWLELYTCARRED